MKSSAPSSKPAPRSPKEAKKARLAQALKANLKRRKMVAKANG